jgi:hypothetical protein
MSSTPQVLRVIEVQTPSAMLVHEVQAVGGCGVGILARRVHHYKVSHDRFAAARLNHVRNKASGSGMNIGWMCRLLEPLQLYFLVTSCGDSLCNEVHDYRFL